ncbi:unnamed protein product [Rangifer tarandus platyrhynchus]|uniref:Uncharacterized protein n=1 Tax=Rangifer tarandus platyrhynchus TaxID=3082113 RepID=A0AC59Y181_RANTA
MKTVITLKEFSDFLDMRRFKNWVHETFLVVHWIRIRLPTKGTWVQSLVGEDLMPRSDSATTTTEATCHSYCSRRSSMKGSRSPCSPQLEKVHAQQPSPSTPKST